MPPMPRPIIPSIIRPMPPPIIPPMPPRPPAVLAGGRERTPRPGRPVVQDEGVLAVERERVGPGRLDEERGVQPQVELPGLLKVGVGPARASRAGLGRVD